MSATVANVRRSEEVRLSDTPRPRAAKAGLDRLMPSDFSHGQPIWDAVTRGHGSAKAAAFTMGNKNESFLRRQITEGTIRLREFFEADEAALCEFAEYVLETFRPARKSKRQIALEQIPRLLQLMIDVATEDR